MWPPITREELLRPIDAGEAHENTQFVLIRTPGLHAAQIGKPLRLRWHCVQRLELGRTQQAKGVRLSREVA